MFNSGFTKAVLVRNAVLGFLYMHPLCMHACQGNLLFYASLGAGSWKVRIRSDADTDTDSDRDRDTSHFKIHFLHLYNS